MLNQYDVVVGIPSYNESKTIGYVVQTVGKGLEKYFPGAKCIIVNCDNDSPDGTRDVFLAAEVHPKIDKKYLSTPQGVLGKGNNFLNLFRFVRDVQAKINIVVDADLRSITPRWIKYLGYPVKKGADFVAPAYSRHHFDGTITNHLCYPLVFSLAGLDIRQPIGGDFAFSRRLCSHWLDKEWSEMTLQYGIDIFMSLHAFFGNFRIVESGLGAKIHNASSPKLGRMFEEVMYTLFSTLLEYKSKWLGTWLRKGGKTYWHTRTRDIGRNGLRKFGESQVLDIDVLKLKRDCREEYEKYHELVEWYLSPYAYQKVNDMFAVDYYDLDIMLWSQIVYTMLFLFDGAEEHIKRDLINVLKPLYFARSITFDYLTRRYSAEYAEEEVHNQAWAFLSQKPYLLGLYLGSDIPLPNENCE
jgi:glycosyltransferase involved in cell wall biosynthesis